MQVDIKKIYSSPMIGSIFYFFFIALLCSQSLMDLGSTLIALAVILTLVQKKKRGENLPFPKVGLERIFPIWAAIILVGLLTNLQPETPWLKSFLEFRWILELYFYIAALMILEPKEKDFKKLLPVLLIASFYAVAAYFLKFHPFLESASVREANMFGYRTGGLFLNPMPFAHTYGPLGMLLMGPILYMNRKKISENKFWILCALMTLFAVVLSFTRGVWIGMVAGLLAMGFLINWKKGLMVLSVGAISAGALMLAVPSILERILFSLNPTATYDSERLIIWKANWLIFTEHPIFGLGYSENGNRLREYFDRIGVAKGFLESHAHNQYLHFLAGTGILGLACFLVVVVWFFRMHFLAFKSFDENRNPFWKGLALGVLGAEVCFFTSGVTESNFSIAKNRYFIMTVWALGCWLYFKVKSQKPV